MLHETWADLVTAALLGVDRRDPPELPPGPIADLVADAAHTDPASRLLDAVGAVAAARRAAFTPLAAAPTMQPPEPDDRPMVAARAVHIWRQAVSEWPVLDDEWVVAVIEAGRRLPADALVELLERTRRHPVARARVLVAAGPIGPWLVEQLPEVVASERPPPRLDAEALTTLGELPTTPELAELLGVDALTFARRIVGWFETHPVGAPDRPVLVNLFARCRPGVLVDAADALGTLSSGIAQSMAAMCRARHEMLTALD